MQIDVAIIIILLIFAFLGFKNGLARTILHAFGWIVAILASFLLRNQIKGLLMDHTTIYDRYLAHVEKVCRAFSGKHTGNLTENIPGAIGDTLDELGNQFVTETARTIADITFGVFTVIGFAIIIKLILFLVSMLVSKRYHDGFVGGLDGFAGFLVGILQGGVVVLILLSLLMPVALAINPDYYDALKDMMDRAIFADILYDHNPILQLIHGFLPENLIPAEWLSAKSGGFDTLNPSSLV
ncbi:MAG: CvpA family protein [Clostridiales Family XIII bacterium]|jgi:uncharacterized membrane protein required for colicin V production|nr:CvpA family protein [Clostridiales Family XIII bacterium]